jgi:hypothetical protein
MLKLPTLASMIYFLILSWETLWMGATSGARTTLFLSEARRGHLYLRLRKMLHTIYAANGKLSYIH